MNKQEILDKLNCIETSIQTTSATMNDVLNEKNRLQQEYSNMLLPNSEYNKLQEQRKLKKTKIFRLIFLITLIIAVLGAFTVIYFATISKGDLYLIKLTSTLGFIFAPIFVLALVLYFFCDFHFYNSVEEENGATPKRKKIKKIKPTKEMLELYSKISSASESYEFYYNKLKFLEQEEKELNKLLDQL